MRRAPRSSARIAGAKGAEEIVCLVLELFEVERAGRQGHTNLLLALPVVRYAGKRRFESSRRGDQWAQPFPRRGCDWLRTISLYSPPAFGGKLRCACAVPAGRNLKQKPVYSAQSSERCTAMRQPA